MVTKVTHKFEHGQAVYLAGDPDQVKRSVVNIVLTPLGVMYTIRMEGSLVDVYEDELTEKPDVI